MKLTRRDFVKYSIASATYLTAGRSALGQMMGGGMGGSTTIDPQPGAAFKDPAVMTNLSTIPGLVEVNVEAKVCPVNINGTIADLLTYNDCYPAPTIKVNKGDRLKVHFRNSLPMMGTNILGQQREMTNLHTHGLHVSPSGNSDNSMLMFMSGDTFDYEFNLMNQYPSTLNIYHPHVHETVAEQAMFHCHILEHEDIGMMGIWDIMGDM